MFKTPRLHMSSLALALVLGAISIAFTGCGGSPTPANATLPTTAPAPPAPPAPGGAPSSAPNTAGALFSFADVDDMSGWTSCGKTMNGKECAGGRGVAPTTLSQHAADPSLAGSSAHFWLGGTTRFSNVMWWKQLQDIEPKATKYRYEFYVYMKNPDRPEALEFDVNQSAKGIRWVFGTECNFKDSHHWDVWDASAHWVPTNVPCNTFQANTWTHVVWNFERAGDQSRYVSIEVNGVSYPVNMSMRAEKTWPWAGSLNVAFQMDGDIDQSNFDVWVDKISVAGW
jgi:hypothetical protein